MAISEAVLDIYKSGYRESFDFDRVKIYKGRKSKDVKKMDTILLKFQGGPRTAMFLDVVKNPGVILDPEVFEFYKFKLAGVVNIDDRENYVIEFEQFILGPKASRRRYASTFGAFQTYPNTLFSLFIVRLDGIWQGFK